MPTALTHPSSSYARQLAAFARCGLVNHDTGAPFSETGRIHGPMHGRNVQRADHVRELFARYLHKHHDPAVYLSDRTPHAHEARQVALIDMLTDLHHLADDLGIDYHEAADAAAMHHDAEQYAAQS